MSFHSKILKISKSDRQLFIQKFQIGEFQSLVQSLKNSGHYKYFQDKVTLWENRLADLDFIIHHLNDIQRRWVYLEPVFNQGTLKGEEGRFKRVDDEFRFASIFGRFLNNFYSILISTENYFE